MRKTARRRQKWANRKEVIRCRLGIAAVLILVLGVFVWHLKKPGKTLPVESDRYRIQVSDPTESEAYRKQGTEPTANRSEDLLILVNKDHVLDEDYSVDLHWLENGSCAVAEEMYESLKRMLTEGSQDGREFVVASGYRSREKQQELLDEDILAAIENQGLSWQEAYEQETKETMPPGYSEHETGLAADIVSLSYQILDEQQEYTAENQWLQENCSQYGFILRYPKGAEEITGVSYEAWHFRYVGETAAEEIMSRGITLEEYLGV